MAKRRVDIRKIFIPSDLLALLVIVAGILIALFYTEIQIRLIGISIAVLGGVAIAMLIFQRASEMVEIKHQPKEPQANFRITTKKVKGATSTVIEDFDMSFDPDDKPIEKKKEAPKPKERNLKPEKPATPKPKTIAKPLEQTKTEKIETIQKAKAATVEPAKDTNDFMSSDEGFRVIGKAKPGSSVKEEDKKEEIKAEPKEEAKIQEPSKNQSKKKQNKKNKAKAKQSEQKKLVFDDTLDTDPLEALNELNSKANVKEQAEPVSKTIETKAPEVKATTSIPVQKELIKEPVKEEIKAEIKEEVIKKEEVKEESNKATQFTALKVDQHISFLTDEELEVAQEPKKEFEYFMNRVLRVIRSVTNTRTAAFILVNQDKNQLVLEAIATDAEKAICKQRKIPLGNDIISQIAKNGKPEILTEISPSAELELLPYYERKVGTLSFIGVPVYYNESIIGVLCADTNNSDVYDSMMVTFLGHFTRLISALVHSYTDKYDLLQASRTLDVINNFKDAGSHNNLEDILNSLLESVSQFVDADKIGICGYNDNNESWELSVYHDKDSEEIPQLRLEDSLLGYCLMNNQTIVAPLEANEVRFSENEKALPGGVFLAVPIPLKTISSSYGALFIEAKNPSFGDQDIEVVEVLCEHSGSALEKLHFIELLQSSAMYDNLTGIFNPPAFFKRISEEYMRSNDFGNSLSLCLFKIDKYKSLSAEKYQERMERVMIKLIETVNKFLRPYDIFGRVDADTFSILLVNTPAQKAQMLMERLRQEIAISVIEIENERFTVTISIGIADNESSKDLDSFLGNAETVMKMSLEKTNSLHVF